MGHRTRSWLGHLFAMAEAAGHKVRHSRRKWLDKNLCIGDSAFECEPECEDKQCQR